MYDSLVRIESAVKFERFFQILWIIGIEHYAGFDAPEQIGRECQISLGGPIVAHLANARVDAEYFLDNHDCRLGSYRWFGNLGLDDAGTIKRGENDEHGKELGQGRVGQSG